ncbi:MAG: acyl-CoA thioesterase [Treponema sp.]|nr:acyl-CoA thioesterase [Treponema sp.]MCL2272002.1 acyl-CoA thioesterase [Treponema sp.]
MFKITVTARFGDLDALGHINNIVPATWFELARTPILKIFDPHMSIDKKDFCLIMAHTDYDFTDQLYIKDEIEIRTWISKVGTKSFTVYHEAWQQGRLCVKGSAVIVHYDFNIEKSTPIPEDKKKLLEDHFLA